MRSRSPNDPRRLPVPPTMGCDGSGGRPSARDHHMLGDRVVADGLGGEVLPKARLLETAMGSFLGQRQVIVDPHRPELQLLRDAHGPADVLGENRGCQTVDDVVAQMDGFRFVSE